jgi:glycerophosphoryl diester phosphodiesterase
MAITFSGNSLYPQLPAFDLEGHRGARGLFAENTVPGMLKALELGVTTLEMDVHISNDNKVLLSHDPFINPEHELLPHGKELNPEDWQKYILYQMEYAEIKAFDVGSKPYKRFPEQQLMKVHKPLLAEVVDAVQSYLIQQALPQVFYNIETKSLPEFDGLHHPSPDEFIELLVAVLIEKNVLPYTIIQSFDVRTLQVLHQKYPDVRTSLLVENADGFESNLDALGFTPTIYSPDHKLVDLELIRKAHAQGIKVIPWTVNTLNEMQVLKHMGVDGLISDYPNLYNTLS